MDLFATVEDRSADTMHRPANSLVLKHLSGTLSRFLKPRGVRCIFSQPIVMGLPMNVRASGSLLNAATYGKSFGLTVPHHHVLCDFVVFHSFVRQIFSEARLLEASVGRVRRKR